MKKKVIIVIIVVVLLILLVPIPRFLKDGGTVEYRALIYQISRVHRLNINSEVGYDEGLIIKIFGNQVYNNVNEKTKEETKNKEITQTYSKTIDGVILEMKIPNEWIYEELVKDENNDFYKFALKLYKSDEHKNTILYVYNNPFGFCGTGRTTNEIKLDNGGKAVIGYYGNIEWSDISFYELNPNIAFINYGLENDEAKEVFDFVKTIIIK